jgi:F-type H+-transporting ATPase subunit delta
MNQRQYSAITRSYAQALLRTVRSQGVTQQVQEECRSLEQIIDLNPRLLTLLESPQVTTEAKLELLDKVFGPRIHPTLAKLLRMLVTRDRVFYLANILDRFQELVEEAEGIGHARLTSANPLNSQDKLKLKEVLERFTGSQLRIDYLVDGGLIGGVVFRFRDTLIDGSLRGGLEEVRRRLASTQLIRQEA